MITKEKVIDHVYDVVGIVLVLSAEVFQYLYLFLCLTMESLLITHNLQCHMGLSLVVIGLENLAEASFSQEP